jgi:hypothetical protein
MIGCSLVLLQHCILVMDAVMMSISLLKLPPLPRFKYSTRTSTVTWYNCTVRVPYSTVDLMKCCVLVFFFKTSTTVHIESYVPPRTVRTWRSLLSILEVQVPKLGHWHSPFLCDFRQKYEVL